MTYREDVIAIVKNTDDEKAIEFVYKFLRAYLGANEIVRLTYKNPFREGNL